jgi:hypothetical protein
MNDNYQSYQAFNGGEPLPEAVSTWDPARVVGPAVRMNVVDGEMVDNTQANDRASTKELNPHHGDGSVLATARHPNGLPLYAVEADSLVTVNGVEAPVSFWVKEGFLQKTATGYAEATPGAAEEAPQASEGLGEQDMAAIAMSLQGVDAVHVDNLIASGVGVAVGRVDMQNLIQKFSHVSGADPESSAARLSVAVSAFTRQASAAATAAGIAPADMDAFFAYCRSRPEQLQDTLNRQILGTDLGGWRKMAAQWTSTTAPSLNSLQAAGVPTRVLDGRPEAFIRGQWMSPGAAARAGLV